MNAHGKDASQAMIGLCNKKLAEVLLKEAGIDLHIPSKITGKQLTRLTKLLKDLRVDITGSKDIAQAQVCAGGVDTREIDAASMMSKLIPDCFSQEKSLILMVSAVDIICNGLGPADMWQEATQENMHIRGKSAQEETREIMIRINQIKLPVTHDTVQLEQKIKKR